MGRRELLGLAASGTAGIVITALGVADRANTPAPESPLPPLSAELLTFNVNNRLRSSLLLAIGVTLIVAPIGAYFSTRQIMNEQVRRENKGSKQQP